MQRFVIMGVSGCGKSTVGEALGRALDLVFVDGDALHPDANIQKMSSGIPLTDADRGPWLERVGQVLRQSDRASIVGCSSLKRKYRDIIRAEAGGEVGFLHLYAEKAILADRVKKREGHFMPPALLDSQYADLEHLETDEAGIVIDNSQALEQVIAAAKGYIQDHL